MQALVKLALEPEWEAKFEPNSYGFRLAEDAPRSLYWGEYARLKIAGEDAYMTSGVPATVVAPSSVIS